MNRFYRKYRIVGNWINILLLAWVLLPLIALSFYNHPSIADDYCYIDTVFKYGWLEAMNYYYTGWTGRYFGIFLNHSNPLIFHSFAGFKILPILLLGGMVFALYRLFRHLTPTLSRMAHIGFAGILFFLYLLKMASIAEAFYWMAAFVTYTIPNILTLLWVVLVMRWYRQDTPPARIGVGALSAFLIFAIVGCSETNMILMVLLIAGWWGYRVLFHRKVDALMTISLTVAILSCYFYFISPGNQARIGGNPLGGNFTFSFISSFKKLAILSFDWIFRTPLIFFTFAWLIVLSRLSVGARNYFSVPIWYAGLLYIGVLSAQLFPSYYGVGIEPTARVINCVYFFFLIGWFYLTGVIFHYFQKRNILFIHISSLRYGVLYSLLVISVCWSFYRSSNVRLIYTDLLRGKASAYSKEMEARYARLRDPAKSVVYLPPIKVQPLSIYVAGEEVKTDKEFIWNRCLAGYFGKEAIYLIEDQSGEK